ncbi:MAG: family 16 glycosylhydrolase [Chitinispirillaceae bacterium]|nr:family 16 glycosylhydrolase [Chitinispirillaceae bacterium]
MIFCRSRAAVFILHLIITTIPFAQPSYENYQLIWSDEFETDGLPDASNWGYEEGCSIRNSELQYYARARQENSRVENGFLIIEARRENMNGCAYTAASMITRGKREFMYGIFEIRAKIDVRKGSWPAFWTLGITEEWPSNGEVDIMEYYNGYLHANVAWGTDTRWEGKWDSQTRAVGSDFSDDFHIWRMHWTEDFIDLWVDDFKQNSTDLSTTINGSLATLKNPFHQKAYILVNQAIGANGGDPSGTSFPIQYIVDYVRVYQEGRDTVAPVVENVSASVSGTVTVFFSEGIDKTAAEKSAGYSFDNSELSITGVKLQTNGRTVQLTVEGLKLNEEYHLTVRDITDDALPPNSMNTVTLPFTPSPESGKLTGTLIGEGNPYEGNSSVSYDKAMDGSTTTFADCTGDIVWVGYDLGEGNEAIVTGFRYYPRSGYADRMNGKSFEVSTDGSSWEKVYTIAAIPPENTYTTVAISATKPVRYIRYNGTGGYLNTGEVEFLGFPASTNSVERFCHRNIPHRSSSILLQPPVRISFIALDGRIIARRNYTASAGPVTPAQLGGLSAEKLSLPAGISIISLTDRSGRLLQYRILKQQD